MIKAQKEKVMTIIFAPYLNLKNKCKITNAARNNKGINAGKSAMLSLNSPLIKAKKLL